MKILEGILTDLVDAAAKISKQSGTSGGGISVLETYLDPHDAEDLFEGVLYVLSKPKTNRTTINNMMNIFFPESGKINVPEGVDEQLVKKYKDKLEDVIVKFCTTDAMNIITDLQNSYKKQGKDILGITGYIYLGTILNNVFNDKYSLIDNLIEIYSQFKKDSKLKKWQSSEKPKSARVDRTSPLQKSIDRLTKDMMKQYPGATEEEVTSILKDIIDSPEGLIASIFKSKLGGK